MSAVDIVGNILGSVLFCRYICCRLFKVVLKLWLFWRLFGAFSYLQELVLKVSWYLPSVTYACLWQADTWLVDYC